MPTASRSKPTKKGARAASDGKTRSRKTAKTSAKKTAKASGTKRKKATPATSGKAKPKPKRTPKTKPVAKPKPKAKTKAATKPKAASESTKAKAPPKGRAAKPALTRRSSRKRGGRNALAHRRGPNGEPFTPGDLLLPGGVRTLEEIHYLFRGCAAAERAATEAGITEIVQQRIEEDPGGPFAQDPEQARKSLAERAQAMVQRFEDGPIDTMLPSRPHTNRRNFPAVVERSKGRRREIGAFLRGLDLGRTESSHMDSHGEASLQILMEWAARLENVAEADEPEEADFAQLHRGMDQLELTTELLIIDVEQTLRRLHDRLRAR